MSKSQLLNVLLSPRLSEKSTIIADKHRQFVFKVAKDANKFSVKAAVEQLFKVEVSHVNICNVKGKRRTFGGQRGQCASWKKATVCLKEGFDIDFTGSNFEREK